MNAWSTSGAETLDKLFGVLSRSGTVIGCCLFCKSGSEKSRLWACLRMFTFVLILLCYLFSLIIIVLTMIPTHHHESEGVHMDESTVFSLLTSIVILDGLGCFLTLNFAFAILAKEEGFFDQCREICSRTKICEQSLNQWKLCTMFSMFVYIVVVFGSMGFSLAFMADVLPSIIAIKFDRAAQWLSMPSAAIKALYQLLTLLSSIHVAYHCLFFSSMCGIASSYFSQYCTNLRSETTATFKIRRIAKYQSEYSRLAEWAGCLDDAFKHSCFCQLTLFIVSACLILFLFTSGGLQIGTILSLCIRFAMVTATFFYTAIPAMLLKAQVSEPFSSLTVKSPKIHTCHRS